MSYVTRIDRGYGQQRSCSGPLRRLNRSWTRSAIMSTEQVFQALSDAENTNQELKSDLNDVYMNQAVHMDNSEEERLTKLQEEEEEARKREEAKRRRKEEAERIKKLGPLLSWMRSLESKGKESGSWRRE